jgi:sigma-B regulation protein RsbU (phosphoserine phosphatase)
MKSLPRMPIVACEVRTLVRSLGDAAGANADPFRLLSQVNARLFEDLPMGRFVTAFLAFISPGGVMSWCSGGQGPVFVHPGGGRGADLLEATQPPVGVVPELPGEPPPDVRLGPGAALLVASDGISEAFDAAGEMFGEYRVADVLSANATEPDRAIASLKSAVWRWQVKEEPVDDQTVVMVARR